ncbi:MAG: hypothetical protein V4642_05550 [Bacteroidota bacterium]
MSSIYFRLFFAAIAVCFASANDGVAQSNNQTDTLYPLYVSHRAGNLHNYVFKEETTINRVHSDSSMRNLKREITYFLSQVALKPSEDGFITVQTTIDSMLYRFADGPSIIEYSSMRDAKPNLQFLDLAYATVPVNRTFETVISPYGDVAEVKGEAVDWLRNYVTVEGQEKGVDILAPIQKYLWLDGISDNNLKHFGDLTKGIIPNGKVKRDSVWNRDVSVRMNSIDFSGPVKANISSAKDGIYRIEAASDGVVARPADIRVYGITELVKLNSGKGKASFSIELNDDDVRRVEADYTSSISATIKNETFTDNISTHLSWTLTGQTQW